MSKTCLANKLPADDLQKIITRASDLLLTDIGSPVSLKVKEFLINKDFKSISELSVDPSDYNNAYDFAKDYQAVSLLRKQDVFPTSVDKESASLSKFVEAEMKCQETNVNLRQSLRGLKGRLSSVPFIAQRKIASILGELPNLSDFMPNFGPGASSTCHGRNVTLGDKYQSKIDSPLSAVRDINILLASNPKWMGAMLDIDFSASASATVTYNIVDHNVLAFVPKTAVIDRAICVEPHGLIPLQKVYGATIRRRLLYAGLDLSQQDKINQHYARLGSIDGSYATIDLSSASDTISIAAVADLLPFEWFEALSRCRSPFTKLPDGTLIENEKFSSMGNGFTFELETLIFYGLLLAVREVCDSSGYVGNFGDDIICPSEMADEIMEILSSYGFVINKSKTFITGPFRESCGADFFLGTNVRPYFIKQGITYVQEINRYLNGIRHWSHRLAGVNQHGCDSVARRAWSYLYRKIPSAFLCPGPEYLGDSVIHMPRSHCGGSYSVLYSIITLRQIVPVMKVKRFNSFNSNTQLAVALSGVSRLTLRGGIEKYRINAVKVPFWDWNVLTWLD